MPLGLSRLAGAGVGAARAERAGGRSVARSAPGSPPGEAERSRVLDEVEKPVTALWAEIRDRRVVMLLAAGPPDEIGIGQFRLAHLPDRLSRAFEGE